MLLNEELFMQIISPYEIKIKHYTGAICNNNIAVFDYK